MPLRVQKRSPFSRSPMNSTSSFATFSGRSTSRSSISTNRQQRIAPERVHRPPPESLGPNPGRRDHGQDVRRRDRALAQTLQNIGRGMARVHAGERSGADCMHLGLSVPSRPEGFPPPAPYLEKAATSVARQNLFNRHWVCFPQ